QLSQREVLQRHPAVAPKAHAFTTQTNLLRNAHERLATCRRKHDARPRGYLLGGAVPADKGLQALAFCLRQREGSCSHLFSCSPVLLARPRRDCPSFQLISQDI